MKKELNDFHSLSVEQTLKKLNSDFGGISDERARFLKIKYGLNEITEKKPTPKIIVFLRQFKSLMVYILIAAGLISYFLERNVDASVIAVLIFVNAFIGYFQESRAEQAIKSLKKMIVHKSKVFRSGKLSEIPSKKLVPGDVIYLEEGDRIPADARLIEVKNFRTVEASLTGESLPVDKNLKELPLKTPLADRKNMVYLGTFVAAGSAKAIVVATGDSTAIGKLAKSIDSIPEKKSHFQERTDVMAKYMAVIAAVGALLIFIIGYYFQGLPLEDIFLFTIASLVSGIPEGLPAILATVLAVGAYRMARRNAIIRNKYATETLNIVDVIITDKTGTLTQNTMNVQEIYLPGQKNISVSGEGWNPQGEFFQNGKSLIPLENPHLAKLIHVATFCNDSYLIKEDGTYKIIGDPTEAALVVLGEKAGIVKDVLMRVEKRIDEIPFNPQIKYRASLSVLTERVNRKEIYVVGAPEEILKSSLYILKNGRKTRPTKEDLKEIHERIDALTHKTMRVIGAAYKEVVISKKDLREEDTGDLIFVGVAGMMDPPRAEVPAAIEKAKSAGIRVIMATGDHKNTALAIAKKIGLVDVNEKKVFTGEELAEMSQRDFEKAVVNCSVFARLTPDMKMKIAKTLQSQGRIIAMTGDGVNDAPALKQADIGISMGKIGTDVAREASEMILADDNFASIISAIEEGRTVFINTRQTSFFLVTTGFAEHAAIITTMIMNLPLSLLPIQILWLNVVTGGLNNIALSVEKVHEETLQEKPKKKNEEILNRDIAPFLIIVTLVMIVLTVWSFVHFLSYDVGRARTAAFIVLSSTQIFNLFNMRSIKRSIFEIGFLSNKYVLGTFALSVGLMLLAIYTPFLQGVFQFTPVSFSELIGLFAISSTVLLAGELYKVYKSSKRVE